MSGKNSKVVNRDLIVADIFFPPKLYILEIQAAFFSLTYHCKISLIFSLSK